MSPPSIPSASGLGENARHRDPAVSSGNGNANNGIARPTQCQCLSHFFDTNKGSTQWDVWGWQHSLPQPTSRVSVLNGKNLFWPALDLIFVFFSPISQSLPLYTTLPW